MGSGGHHNPIADVIFGEPMKEAIEVMAADVLDRNQRIAELDNEIERLRAALNEIGSAADGYMEGAGEPEFSVYSWITGVCIKAINGPTGGGR